MYCPNCRKQTGDYDKFCQHCGTPIKLRGFNESPKKEPTTGFFTSTQKVASDTVYVKMKPYIAPKDGKVHVLMINSFSKFLNQHFECETKYTTQLDNIISALQDDGYEIIDIKFNSVKNQGLMGEMEGFHTLVMYR
ncbi:MAG: zinc ribbon domain-containing protein [Oscillospiraceae bacterium]|nr:zinc ribbon domain-containing protein [Oscillospiraceae bacterium]MBR2422040.1 zinc ribbon domain-containing protein [Oscillospiraceae bacterium]